MKYPAYIIDAISDVRLSVEENERIINEMSPNEVFDKIMEYEGFIGYGFTMRRWLKDIFGINLYDYTNRE